MCQRNCRYRMRGDFERALLGGCDYISMTRRSRLKKVYETLGVRTLTKEALALLAPENCPCYEPGERGRVIALEMPTRKTETAEKMRNAECGVRNDEPGPEKKRRQRRYGFDTEKARRLWEQGLNDRQIGERVGATREAINWWRHRQGLTGNVPAHPPLDGKAIRRLNAEGLSNQQIAERLGIQRRAVSQWLWRHGVPSAKKMRNAECGMTTCENCAYLAYEEPVNRYDVYSAHCCDRDKPMMGARRVVATSRVGRPERIERPKWCKRA